MYFMERGKLCALVELISLGEENSLSERLLIATYRASVKHPSIVLLRDLTPMSANQILDPVVFEAGPSAAGLLYLSENEESEFLDEVPRADIVVATTDRLRERLTSMGLNPLEAEEGIQALRVHQAHSGRSGKDTGSMTSAGA